MPIDRRSPFLAAAFVAVASLALLPTDALALAALLTNLGGIDSKERLWLAAFGGLSLGLAFGLFAFELRSRSIAVAVRRLTDLVVGMDGRFDESRRESAAKEIRRLSDELMFAAQRAARERREAEQRMSGWEGLFAAALDAMFSLDAQGHITYINPAAERLFKVKADESTGKLLSDVMLPPTHRSPDNAAFASDLASGKAQGRTQELVAQRSDGRQFPIEVSIAEFANGDQTGFVVVARDISQVRRGRAELKRVRDQAAATQERLRGQIVALERERERAVATVSVRPVAQPARAIAPASAPVASTSPRSDASGSGATESLPAKPAAFTVEDVCGDAIRKLAARAERRGLGFRYEDGELHGVSLHGDPSRLRRVMITLIDSAIRAAEAGEIVVHLRTMAGEGRQIVLVGQVTATAMTDAQAAKMVKPFVNETVTRREGTGYPGRAETQRHIDFLGTRVDRVVRPGAGASFRFHLRFEADLSHVTIDLSALPAPASPRRVDVRPPATDPVRLHQEFSKSAARLRKHAEKPNLVALWAEAHRLKDVWKRHGGRDEIGLVTALAHTSRGGDSTNARLLARRLADALDAAARVSVPEGVRA
jgi:PAS domain S-box-containing protein